MNSKYHEDSYKHSESVYCKASNKVLISSKYTIEGIRIMVILVIESPKCQMQD